MYISPFLTNTQKQQQGAQWTASVCLLSKQTSRMFQKHFIREFRETITKISGMKSSAVKNGSFTGAALRFFRNI